jgi:hypothetical protein
LLIGKALKRRALFLLVRDHGEQESRKPGDGRMGFERIIEEFLERVERRRMARRERELQRFADALDDWLSDLLEHPRPAWREEAQAFLDWQKDEGRIATPESWQSVVDYLEAWAESIGLETPGEEPAANAAAQRSNQPSVSSLGALEPLEDMQLDGTRVRVADRFGRNDLGPPELGNNEGPGVLDDLLNPKLKPLVRSAREYRKAQILAHGDSSLQMLLRTFNEALHRHVLGIEDRHESLESPSERTAGDIADFAKDVSDLALGAAAVGAASSQARRPRISTPPAPTAKPKLALRDRSWKDLIEGKAQKTGTEGHRVRILREAITMAKSGQYDKIWLNRAYSTTTATRTIPRRLPDIIGRRKNGRFNAVEVASKSDIGKIATLIKRNIEAMDQLPIDRQGAVLLKPIRKTTQ